MLFTPRQDTLGMTATRDVQRFLAAIPADGEPPPSVVVEVNWTASPRQ